MRKIKSYLANLWPSILWATLGISIVISPFLFSDYITVGMSTDTFNIICASLCAIAAGLIGLSITAIAIITHNADSILRGHRDILYRESRALAHWLESTEIDDDKLIKDIDELVQLSSSAAIVYKQADSDSNAEHIRTLLVHIQDYLEHLHTQSQQLDEKVSTLDNNDSTLRAELEHLDKNLKSVTELPHIIEYLAYTLARTPVPHLLFRLVDQIRRIVIGLAIVLFYTIASLIFSGILSHGDLLLPSVARLYLSLLLFWTLLPFIPMVNSIFKLYLETLGAEVGSLE